MKIVMFWSDKSLISRAIHAGFLEINNVPTTHLPFWLRSLLLLFKMK